MPGYFKKRRGPQGPNKNEQKVLRAKNAENPARLAGVLGAKFPALKRLKIHLSFADAQGHPLEERDLALGPMDAAVFTIACPGRCGRGSFDFEKKLAETVEARLADSESGAACSEPIYAGAAAACGCQVKCRMELEYSAAPTP